MLENSFHKVAAQMDELKEPAMPSDYITLLIYNVFATLCFGKKYVFIYILYVFLLCKHNFSCVINDLNTFSMQSSIFF
jgi:hypothetical protein